MKILMIGQDRSFTFPSGYPDDPLPHSFAGTVDKLRRHMEELHIVIYAKEGEGRPWQKGNVFVYPTRPTGSLFATFWLYRTASRVLKNHPGIQVILCSDHLVKPLAGHLLRQRFQKPLIVEIMGGNFENPIWTSGHPLNFLVSRFARVMLRRADLVRAYSPEMREKLLGLGISEDKIVTLWSHWRMDLDFFKPGLPVETLRKRFGDPHTKILLFVGRLEPEKNVSQLLRALDNVRKEHKGWMLLIIGDGQLRSSLERQVTNTGMSDHVRFLGWVGRDLPFYYNLGDVLLINSLYEGTPKVIAEAMACGTPVISTLIGGASEWITQGLNGLLVPIDNETALAQAILRFLEDSNLQKPKVSEACRLTVEKEMHNKGIEDYVAIFQRVISAQGTSC